MMDDYYPAADPIPDPEFEIRYTTLMDFLSTSSEMRQTASSSLKQAMWSGSATLAGVSTGMHSCLHSIENKNCVGLKAR